MLDFLALAPDGKSVLGRADSAKVESSHRSR
jgi:hypothetical protein